MVPAYFAQCITAFTIGKMWCASSLAAKVTKHPNRSIQITKPTSAAFCWLSAWDRGREWRGMLTVSVSLTLCVYRGSRETRVVVLESGWWRSESYPTICVTWAAASLGVHSSALMAMPGTLFRLFSDSCQTAWLSVCVCSSVCVRVCVCVSFVPFVFYFHFNHNCVQLLFLLPHFFHLFSRSLSAAGKIGWLFLPFPFPLSIRFSGLLSLSFPPLFFCFCFYDFVLASVTCCLSPPLLYSLRTFSVHFLHDFPHEQQQQPGMCVCVCACSTVCSTIAHHIN